MRPFSMTPWLNKVEGNQTADCFHSVQNMFQFSFHHECVQHTTNVWHTHHKWQATQKFIGKYAYSITRPIFIQRFPNRYQHHTYPLAAPPSVSDGTMQGFSHSSRIYSTLSQSSATTVLQHLIYFALVHWWGQRWFPARKTFIFFLPGRR
jgi:hypothetical protein